MAQGWRRAGSGSGAGAPPDAAERFAAHREAGQAPIQRQAWPFLHYSLPFSPPHAEILPTTANIERSRKPSFRRHPHRQPSAKILAGHLPVTSNSNHHRVFAYLPIGCRNKHIKHCQQQVLLLSRSHKFCEKLHSNSPKEKAATAIVLWQSARARRGQTSRRAIARQRGKERGVEEIRLQNALLEEGTHLGVRQGGDVTEALR